MSVEQDNSETSVRVAVRIRPQISREIIDMCQVCTTVTFGEPQVWLGKDKAFTFDHVFDVDSKQGQIYDTCVRDLVEGCFSGYNATVLAYGQTGSGKTYTMGTGFEPTSLNDAYNGDEEFQGIVPRAVHHLFDGINKRTLDAQQKNEIPPEFQIKAQFIELYNEEIIDLLDEAHNDKQIRIHQENGSIQMAGITSRSVNSISEAFGCLKLGALSRTTASTQMNTQSSRSHAIFTLSIQQTKVLDDVETLTAKFHFVDLAGSERLKRTGATGERAKEGISINTGLLCLGNVISALGDKSKKATHVPYRDSKLTRLLQDSLGGNSQTLMIACISPSDRDFMETLSTLRYANRAKNIKNKVVSNHDSTSHIIALLRKEIQELKLELMEYKQGKRVVGEDGDEFINDVYHENSMLLNEIQNLKTRNKALQETHGRLDSNETDGDDEDDEEIDNSEDISEDNTLEEAKLELFQLNDDISTKELLIAELEKSQRKMESLKHHYESKLIQLQNQICEIEKERDQVLIKLTENGNKSDEKTKKVHEDYDKKIKTLQEDLRKLHDAKKEHALAMKNQAKYEQQVRKLRNEVCDMKRQKVNVMNKMKEEASRHRVSELHSTKKIAQLTKQERLKDVRIKNLEVENSRLKQTLKRKDAEIKALKNKTKNITTLLSRHSPKLVKNKRGKVEQRDIDQMNIIRQAIWNFDQRMCRDLAQRHELSVHLEETLLRLKEASRLDEHDIVRELSEDIESISSNIHYLDQNIRECQINICQLEDDLNNFLPRIPSPIMMPPPSAIPVPHHPKQMQKPNIVELPNDGYFPRSSTFEKTSRRLTKTPQEISSTSEKARRMTRTPQELLFETTNSFNK